MIDINILHMHFARIVSQMIHAHEAVLTLLIALVKGAVIFDLSVIVSS